MSVFCTKQYMKILCIVNEEVKKSWNWIYLP